LYQGAVQSLADSRFWYHSEVFDAERLRTLLDARVLVEPERFVILLKKFLELKDPALVCYYLFFPGHEEPLEGCPDSDLAKRWASCAGAWGCVAVLLQGDGTAANYKPKMIGVTTRNTGMVQFLGQELRVGMRVFDWNLTTKVTHDRGPNREQGEHARVFVSRGAHGLKLDQSPPSALTAFSPTDYSGRSCGAYETVAAERAKQESHKEMSSELNTMVLAKIITGAVGGFVTGFLGPAGAVGGMIGGAIAGTSELFLESGGPERLAHIQGPDPPAPAQFDHPPTANEIGVVIHPVGVEPPGAPLDKRQVWPRFNKADPSDDRTLIMTDGVGRSYSLWVAAQSVNQNARPVWLPSEEPNKPSFKGRWGNRVVSDPFNRRAGMRFPEFWAMFLEAIGMKDL
jgi:hypothetical protein